MQRIEHGILITQNKQTPILYDGAVVVDADRIVEYGESAAMAAKYPAATVVDAGGKVIMPGLINAHTHIYSALARGITFKNPKVSRNFSEILENFWWKIDAELTLEEVAYSAYLTYIDGIKRGVTTVFDHHASFGAVEGSLQTIANVAQNLGVRTSLCFEVSDRAGKDIAKQTVQENKDFIDYANAKNTDMLHALCGLHASFTISDETMAMCQKAGEDAGFHVHVAEGINDVTSCLATHGSRVVERLHHFGILGEKTLAIHCIHVGTREMDLLKQTGTMVVHNPQSNMGNAVGCSPVIAMLERGILVGMGTDAYTHDMLESMKTTNILHKHQLGDPSVAWGEPLTMLFENNQTIAQKAFGVPVGQIQAGYKADLIIMDYTPITPLKEENIGGHIHFGFVGKDVSSTMIDGKWVMKERVLCGVDEQQIAAKSRELASQLWARL